MPDERGQNGRTDSLSVAAAAATAYILFPLFVVVLRLRGLTVLSGAQVEEPSLYKIWQWNVIFRQLLLLLRDLRLLTKC